MIGFWTWRLALVVLIAGLPAIAPRHAPVAQAAPPGLSFSPSGFDGGGFMNVIDERDGLLVAGGDVSGVHRSTDGGALWSPRNEGFEIDFPRFYGIADVAFSEAVPGEIYACTRRGFYASTDSGLTWTFRAPDMTLCGPGAGNNSVPGALPSPHPRSTGDLIAQAEGNIYIGSVESGVFRSTDNGFTWTPIGLQPEVLPDTTTKRYFARGVAIDPEDPDTLYVGTYGDGVWKITDASGTPSATALAGSPAIAEETIVVGGNVYVAASSQGIFKSEDDGATWSAINNGAVDVRPSTKWQAIAGYVDDDDDVVLYAGSYQPVGSGFSYNSVTKSVNGGASWSSVTLDPTKVHNEMGGPGGAPWFFAVERPHFPIGRSLHVASQILIDDNDPETVYVAGRSGVWKSTDGGDNWYPAVRGLGVTINRAVVVDPANPARAYVGNTDWTVLRSNDAMATVTIDNPMVGNTAFGMAIDARLHVGVGDRDDNVHGRVWSKAADGSGSWLDENLQSVAGGKRPFAVAVGVNGTGERVVLAAVDQGGVKRKVGGGAWATVSTAAGPMNGVQVSKQASFSWVPGSPNVYLYDRPTGVWRSQNFGASWTRIWHLPSNEEHTGYVGADPLDDDVLYVSNINGLYRLTGVSTGVSVEHGTIVDTLIPGAPRPGAVALVARGDATLVYVASRSGLAPYAAPGLYASDDGTTWADVSDELYRRAGHIPHQMAAGPDGRVFMALDGAGVIVGTPPVLLSVAAATNPVTEANETATGAAGTATPGAAVSVVASDGTTTMSPIGTFASPSGTWTVTGLDASALDDGPIRFIATATVGSDSVTSAHNAVKFSAVPPPPHDAFAGALGLLGTVSSVQRTTAGATKEAGEPHHAGNAGGNSIWFTWKSGVSGNVTFDTAGSNFDTLLAVYTGSSVGGLTQVAFNDNRSASDDTSAVTFVAQPGVTYRIAVDGRDGASGNAFFNRPIAVTNSGYKPAISVASPLGTTVLWQFVGPSSQRVLSTIGLFDSGVRAPGTSFAWQATTAGQFSYRSVSASMTGKVSVPPLVTPTQGSRTTPFLVTWALSVPSGAHFDVQVKRPGGAWLAWKTNVTATNASYTPGAGAPAGTYSFRARVRMPGGISGWSPLASVTV